VINASGALETVAPRPWNYDSEFRRGWLITSIGSADTRHIGWGMPCK